ncbi:hypothetical protein UlMin_010651 [Ulmus minor]
MSYSSSDLTLLSNENLNFETFLQSVTPVVEVERLPKAACPENVEYSFSLSSIWEYYKDKRAKNVGIPILLSNGETVMEFYCPTLSTLEIHTKRVLATPIRSNGKGPFLSDKEKCDKKLIPILGNNSTKIASDGYSAAGHEASSQTTCSFGNLYCQNNVTTSPSARTPLCEKIDQLAEQYPGLKEFQSIELTPYSWIAIAWYPIKILVTKNESDLCACFVTFHNLSSILENEDDKKKSPPTSYNGKELTQARCSKEVKEEKGVQVSISPFAVATYKTNIEELWVNPKMSNEERIIANLNAIQTWFRLR